MQVSAAAVLEPLRPPAGLPGHHGTDRTAHLIRPYLASARCYPALALTHHLGLETSKPLHQCSVSLQRDRCAGHRGTSINQLPAGSASKGGP